MLSNTINTKIAAYARQNIYTAIPAKILSVNKLGSKQTVDAVPLIDRVLSNDTSIQPAKVYNVPIMFPSGGGGLLSFPLVVGDTILLVYSMRSLEEWLDGDGSATIPQDNRHHHTTDAIGIPGLYTSTSHLTPNTSDVDLKFKEMHVTLEASSGDITLSNSSGSLKLKSDSEVLHSSGAKITTAGDFISATGVSLNLHVHAQGVDSDSNTQVPTNPPTV